MNCFSDSAISGSLRVRPIRRLSEPIVFLKLDVSSVLAASPIERDLGPNETRDLQETRQLRENGNARVHVRSSSIRRLVYNHINSSLPRHANLKRPGDERVHTYNRQSGAYLAGEVTKVDSDDAGHYSIRIEFQGVGRMQIVQTGSALLYTPEEVKGKLNFLQ